MPSNNRIIGFTIGILLTIVGVAALFPAMLDYTDGHDNYRAFLDCSLVSLFFGGGLIISNYSKIRTISIRQTFLLTTLSWFFMSLFSSFPLYFSDLNISFTDAFFESISGITTTGSTVLSGLDEMSHGILLWRSIMQWIGGIGIIAFAIVILPFLRVGGMQLFQTESSDRSDKVMPKTLQLVKALLAVYILLTIMCTLTFYILGMTLFDAVNHAMTTIPTGGYSTHDASFGYFESPALHYSCALYMLMGGVPFVLYVKFLFQGKVEFWKDEQFRGYILMLCLLISILSLWFWTHSENDFAYALQYSTFNIISVITTTGYATTDYTLWGAYSVAFFFFITFLGACAGSTSGGVKVMRLVVAYKLVKRQINTLIYPRGVFRMHFQNKPISNKAAMTIMSFLAVYVAANVVLTVLLVSLGLDFKTAISGSATALANVGPGVGDIIGPAGNFSTLPDTAKWLLGAGMLLGRLEIMTVLILLSPYYWRDGKMKKPGAYI